MTFQNSLPPPFPKSPLLKNMKSASQARRRRLWALRERERERRPRVPTFVGTLGLRFNCGGWALKGSCLLLRLPGLLLTEAAVG